MNSIDLFVKNLNSKHPTVPISDYDITELEQKLNSVLPQSYKYLISTYGLIHSPNVLSKTCDLNSEVSEVRDFLSLEDVYSLSKLYEMSGLPKGHALFASDCQGNMFCFKLTDSKSKQQDSPVWFFNYDLCTVIKIADSFTEWLDAFSKL